MFHQIVKLSDEPCSDKNIIAYFPGFFKLGKIKFKPLLDANLTEQEAKEMFEAIEAAAGNVKNRPSSCLGGFI